MTDSIGLRLTTGLILTIDEERFRVLDVYPDETILCRIDGNKFITRTKNTFSLYDNIEKGNIQCQKEEFKTLDLQRLQEEHRNEFNLRKRIVLKILSQIGSNYVLLEGKSRKPFLDKIIEEENLCRKTVIRWVTAYLQSGKSDISLADKRWFAKGRLAVSKNPSEKNWNSFYDTAIEWYRNPESKISIQQTYEDLLRKFFSEEIYDIDTGTYERIYKPQRPTYDQFYYYFRKKISKEEKDIILKGPMNQRNNERAFIGTAETGVEWVYEKCEMDAWEANYSLVSAENPDDAVGRAIVYAIRDVFSRAIIAISVAFNNNSNIGAMNCIECLNQDKEELLKKYGINIKFDESMWPTGYKPAVLRLDNGADFTSKQFVNMMSMLDIIPEYASPGMGSHKSIVERGFHDMDYRLRKFAMSNGYITKEHGSDHHKEATLNIHQFTGMIYNYVIAYNRSEHSGIRLTKDMIENGVEKTPQSVMKYCLCRHRPQTLKQGDDFTRALLFDANAKITRYGIEFKKLVFSNYEDDSLQDEIYAAKDKVKSFPILYDPRSVDKIFYVRDNVLMRAPLKINHGNQNSYLGCSFAMTDYLFNSVKEKDRILKAESMRQRMMMNDRIEAIVAEATETKPNYSNTKDMRSKREIEKMKTEAEFALDKKNKPQTDEIIQELQTDPVEKIVSAAIPDDENKDEDITDIFMRMGRKIFNK